MGYHGRSSSVVVSPHDVHRPCGQLQTDAEDPSKGSLFGTCKTLDFELEMVRSAETFDVILLCVFLLAIAGAQRMLSSMMSCRSLGVVVTLCCVPCRGVHAGVLCWARQRVG